MPERCEQCGMPFTSEWSARIHIEQHNTPGYRAWDNEARAVQAPLTQDEEKRLIAFVINHSPEYREHYVNV
jgi:hypothetical protein